MLVDAPRINPPSSLLHGVQLAGPFRGVFRGLVKPRVAEVPEGWAKLPYQHGRAAAMAGRPFKVDPLHGLLVQQHPDQWDPLFLAREFPELLNPAGARPKVSDYDLRWFSDMVGADSPDEAKRILRTRWGAHAFDRLMRRRIGREELLRRAYDGDPNLGAASRSLRGRESGNAPTELLNEEGQQPFDPEEIDLYRHYRNLLDDPND